MDEKILRSMQLCLKDQVSHIRSENYEKLSDSQKKLIDLNYKPRHGDKVTVYNLRIFPENDRVYCARVMQGTINMIRKDAIRIFSQKYKGGDYCEIIIKNSPNIFFKLEKRSLYRVPRKYSVVGVHIGR